MSDGERKIAVEEVEQVTAPPKARSRMRKLQTRSWSASATISKAS
jgi:hypothetical protein